MERWLDDAMSKQAEGLIDYAPPLPASYGSGHLRHLRDADRAAYITILENSPLTTATHRPQLVMTYCFDLHHLSLQECPDM